MRTSRKSAQHLEHRTKYGKSNNNGTSRLKLSQIFSQEALPHMRTLYSTALQLTREPNDANDLLQETYLKAYGAFHMYKQGTNCKAWMKRIMKNAFINGYRKNSREPDKVEYAAIEEFYESIRHDQSESSDLETRLYNNLLSDEVLEALDALPDHFRTVIILRDLEDYTYEEIAIFVNCPLGTVRSRIFRSRKMLADLLRQYARVYGYTQTATP